MVVGDDCPSYIFRIAFMYLIKAIIKIVAPEVKPLTHLRTKLFCDSCVLTCESNRNL